VVDICFFSGIYRTSIKSNACNTKERKMKYVPKTGPDACKRNFEMVKDYFKKNPQSTGVEIAKALSLSLPTVYRHLKKLKY